jgi:putative endonuclease
MKEHLATGARGEEIARRFLRKNNYRILESNWRFKRAELDIIARKGDWLVFVEVKTRSGTFFGQPESFVDKKKQKLMVDAAVVYMNERNYRGEFRFDIVAIVLKNMEEFAIRHFEDAFFPGFEGFV